MKNELQNKLANYEATPPAHLWPDIEAALNDQTSTHAALLYKFEQAPPLGVWNKIEESLSQKEIDKAVVINKSRSNLLRYAAAAAIFILLASAITFIVNRDKARNDVVHVPPPAEKEGPHNNFSANNDDTNDSKEFIAAAPKERSNKANTNSELIKKDKTTFSRYLTIADNEGKKVRLSKKVASVFNCADNLASVKGIRCKENIESLQQKISASLVSPSGDFSGLMDMIRSLEENN